MTPHRCDERCVCPECGEALLLALASGQHACSDPACVNAHGILGIDWMELRMRQFAAAAERRRSPLPLQEFP